MQQILTWRSLLVLFAVIVFINASSIAPAASLSNNGRQAKKDQRNAARIALRDFDKKLLSTFKNATEAHSFALTHLNALQSSPNLACSALVEAISALPNAGYLNQPLLQQSTQQLALQKESPNCSEQQMLMLYSSVALSKSAHSPVSLEQAAKRLVQDFNRDFTQTSTLGRICSFIYYSAVSNLTSASNDVFQMWNEALDRLEKVISSKNDNLSMKKVFQGQLDRDSILSRLHLSMLWTKMRFPKYDLGLSKELQSALKDAMDRKQSSGNPSPFQFEVQDLINSSSLIPSSATIHSEYICPITGYSIDIVIEFEDRGLIGVEVDGPSHYLQQIDPQTLKQGAAADPAQYAVYVPNGTTLLKREILREFADWDLIDVPFFEWMWSPNHPNAPKIDYLCHKFNAFNKCAPPI